MKYRAEIDGLRAIAVISVILYHAEIVYFGRDWFKGGFIGVDIFFVISGYLITRIILSELYQTGSFNLPGFYERRARRILPMLFTVVLVSFPFAWQRLLPSDFIEYSQSILSAIFFSSNFFFYYATTEYGADSALLKPFLHTWSLGVEEQFYIVFPILLMVFYKFLKNHLLMLIGVMLLLSLQFANLMNDRNIELNFYLPFTRFWELLVGSVLAYSELRFGRIKNDLTSSLFPGIGLCCILYSILFFNSDTPHPSFETLIPVIGVALVIAFVSTEDWAGKILCIKPIVGIGLISYSAYLWHFPIFAFSRVSESTPSNYDKLVWIALTLILSVISYKLIEQPVRSRKFSTGKLVCFVTILLPSIVALNLLVDYSKGFPSRYPTFISDLDFGEKPWLSVVDPISGKSCHNGNKPCLWIKDERSKRIAIIGDSDAASFAMTLIPEFNKNYNVLLMSSGMCPFYIGGELLLYNKQNGKEEIRGCSQIYQEKRLSELENFNPDLIIHIGRLNEALRVNSIRNKESAIAFSSEEYILLGYETLTGIADTIYIQTLPRVNKIESPLNYILGIIENHSDDAEVKKKLKENPFHFNPNERDLEEWRIIKNLFDEDSFFDTWKYICEMRKEVYQCSGFDFNGLFYFDKAHPSDYVVKLLYPDLIEKIEKKIGR